MLPADGEAHDGELGDRGVGRVDVSLLRGIVLAAGDGLVDGLAGLVVDEGEGGPRVGDGGVAGAGDRLAGHDGGGAVEHPEALGVVHGGVVRGLAAEGRLVDVAEGVEGFALVRVLGVFDGAELDGEELGCLGDVRLRDHVLHRGLHRRGGDGVDGPKGEAEEPVAGVLLELGGEGLGQFDGLVLDDETAHVDDVGSHGARGRGVVPVGNLPGRAAGVFERAGLGGVEDGVAGAFCRGCGQLCGPQLCDGQPGRGESRQQQSMLHTQRSADPVSKSSVKVLPGVPMVTGQRYSESFWESSAGTSPVWSLVGAFFWRTFCIRVFPPIALLSPCLPWW